MRPVLPVGAVIGREMRRRLTEMERSQAWFARKTGVVPSSVTHWIRGDVLPTADKIATIAQVLSISTDELLLGEKQREEGEAA